MSIRKPSAESALATLQRLRELELQQARVEYASANAAVEQQEQRILTLHEGIAETQRRAQNQVMHVGGVSAGALQDLQKYGAWQGEALRKQQHELQIAEAHAEDARVNTTHRFRQLSVVERLRERRNDEAVLERQRADQKRLDDQALLAPHDRNPHLQMTET